MFQWAKEALLPLIVPLEYTLPWESIRQYVSDHWCWNHVHRMNNKELHSFVWTIMQFPNTLGPILNTLHGWPLPHNMHRHMCWGRWSTQQHTNLIYYWLFGHIMKWCICSICDNDELWNNVYVMFVDNNELWNNVYVVYVIIMNYEIRFSCEWLIYITTHFKVGTIITSLVKLNLITFWDQVYTCFSK